ncbi:hypothetical protein CHS0354_039921 [Potamilus streckersoni]|uniref:Uncharacterized protein n=1 Tax=Potamilus streckersoni TaxID=2493646 RepID=A0AAE0WE80_9BIVA|nr:hypothetical protein CHS0354_039921 [Potamilus streckersoni]
MERLPYGTIQCSITSCKTFQEIFKDAGTFCNKIWDYTWQVVPDSQPCMRVQFNSSSNPNDAVARWKANQLGNKSNSIKADIVVISLMAVLFVM